MELREQIDPGICGFTTTVTAATEDGRHVTFAFETGCEIIAEFERQVREISPVDAIQTLSPDENPVLALARELLRTTGCCEACVVPVGAVKAMYVVTDLALARDVSLKLVAEWSRATSDDEAPIPHEQAVPFAGSLRCTTLDVLQKGAVEDHFPRQKPGF